MAVQREKTRLEKILEAHELVWKGFLGQVVTQQLIKERGNQLTVSALTLEAIARAGRTFNREDLARFLAEVNYKGSSNAEALADKIIAHFGGGV